MSSEEFAEWCAFDRMSPGDPEREDIRIAMLCSVIANVNKGRKGRSFTIDDFLLKFKRKHDRPKTWKELMTKLQSWKSTHDAHLERQTRKTRR